MKQEIKNLLTKVIKENYNIDLEDIKLENPPKKELGDYAFGCFLLARDLKKNPAQIASDISELISEESLIESSTATGPYLNIKVNKNSFTEKFLNFIESREGKFSFPTGKSIYIDYIGANVGKPMHIGHMCTPNQGQVMINCYKKLGYNVVSDSHIGDWGIIFGKLILAFKNWGDKNKLKENAVEHLLELYIKITSEVEKEKGQINKFYTYNKNEILNFHEIKEHDYHNNNEVVDISKKYLDGTNKAYIEIKKLIKQNLNLKIENKNVFQKYNSLEEQIRNEFKKLSSGDEESIKLWESFTKKSIEAMNVLLGRMNIKPDFNIGESFYEGLNLPKMEVYPDLDFSMKDIVDELKEKGIASVTENDDGTKSVGVHFSEESKISSCILQKRDGTHGYLASDLAAIKYRITNWDLEKIIYFVDSRQQLHFKQAFEISKNSGWIENTEVSLAYNGFISLKDGAMSTRKGRIIKLDKLLDEAESRAEKIILEKRDDIQGEELKELSKKIGIGAIKYGYLKKNRESDIVFDWDEFMSFEGNSGPYIQYAYVRAIRILEKENYNSEDKVKNASFGSSSEIDLAKKIMNFKNILEEATIGNYPHIIAGYAYELTKAFSNFYNNVTIKYDENEKNKKLKLILVDSFAKTLKETFEVLGIEMPEKM